MNNALLTVFIIFIVYLIFKDFLFNYINTVNKCNKIDGRCYNTVNKYNNTDKASELLAEINLFCLKFLKHLRDKYIWNDHNNYQASEIVKYLLSNYNPDGIIENAPVSDENTSYVDDKGKVFAICLREKESGNHNFHHISDLQFVILHELSHMATKSFGHGVEFWTNFKFLLTEAYEANLHTPVNYKQNPLNYCSLIVDYNPYFDNNLISI
jgi:hypothetical protein